MRTAPALLLALLLAAAPALADRTSAAFFAGRGDKALQAKDYAGAEENFRRALAEDVTYHPARYGLAQALLGRGQPRPALRELERFVADAKAEPSPPPEWKALLAKAERQFADLDAAGAGIEKIVDRYVADLVALARKCAAKDPATAERAAKRALLLRPGDAQARDALAAVDDLPKGPPIVLFRGADLRDWEGVEFPFWGVAEGTVVGAVPHGSRQIRSRESFEGDFDLRMEARILEDTTGEDNMLALLGGYRGEYDFVGIGLINRKVYFFDRTTEKEKRILHKVPIAEWTKPFDPTAWTVYELRFREEEITALVAGEVVGKDRRSDRRREGFAGIYAQAGKVAFRAIEVQRR